MTSDQTIHYAMSCVETGRLDEALAACRQVLQVVPREHRAIRLLGAVSLKSGQLDQAAHRFRQAIALAPGQIEYYDNLCTALSALQQWTELEQTARRMLQLAPRYSRAENSLGIALKELGRPEESAAAFRRALSIEPESVQVLSNLGNLLRTLGRWSEAEQACRTAVSIAPRMAGTHLNLGAVLHEQQKHDAAIAAFDQALALDPGMALAAFNRGASQEAISRFADAEASYRLALELQSDMLAALNNLGSVLKYQGRLQESIDCFRDALQARPDYMIAHTNLLLAMQCDPQFSPEELLREHREWNARHAGSLPDGFTSTAKPTSSASTRDPAVIDELDEPGISSCPSQTVSEASRAHVAGVAVKRRTDRDMLRVGFVSPDLGNHPVGRFLIAAFEQLDRNRIRTFCYSDRKHPDSVTERFRRASSVWRETRLINDAQLAATIRDDEIDFLIDLTGHTGHHRLLVFARRPAAVQASWIGYAGTTGLDAIDWLIADPFLIPAGSERYYSERVLRLPACHVCFNPPTFAPSVTEPPVLENGFVTFGSFNKPDKTTPDVIAVWSQLLQQVPDSRLVLRNRGLDDRTHAEVILRQFERNGLSRERVELDGWETHEALLGCWSRIDVALDTFPFSGLATSADALWMGVPIVTLAGETFASRQTGSLLNAIGATSTIAANRSQYVAKAVELASDPARIREFRHGLRERVAVSSLCDAAAFARSLEQIFSVATGQLNVA